MSLIRYLWLVSINFFLSEICIWEHDRLTATSIISIWNTEEKKFTLVQHPMRRCKTYDIAHWIANDDWKAAIFCWFCWKQITFLHSLWISSVSPFRFHSIEISLWPLLMLPYGYINLLRRFRFHLLGFKCFLFVLLVLGVTMPLFRIILSHHQIHTVKPSKTRRKRKKWNYVMAGIRYDGIANCIYSGDSDHMVPNKKTSTLSHREQLHSSVLLTF